MSELLHRAALDNPPAIDLAAALAEFASSDEPTVVFASLARQCVPDFCDDCTIDLAEDGGRSYRISPLEIRWAGRSGVTGRLSAHEVRATISSAGRHGGPGFVGEVVYSWNDHIPTAADALIARLVADLAVTTIERGRESVTAERALDTVAHLQIALRSSRQIGAALGILMTTLKITDQGALDLLKSASQRTNVKLRDLADDVIRTGVLDRE